MLTESSKAGPVRDAKMELTPMGDFHQHDSNKSIVRRLWEDVWNSRDFDLVDAIMSPDYAEHEKQYATKLLMIFPDARFAVEEMIAEGDKVVSRVTFRGTHQAEYRGIPATGRSVEVKAVWIHRLAGGRIVEGIQWGFVDWLGLLQQLGATIAPPASDRESGNSLG
jgi:predicted ester cyclase